jgi:succinyl-diaminopimelate desuccinylase
MTPLARRLAERTLELCRIPSVTGAEGPLADHLEPWLRARFGPHVVRVGHSLVAGRLDDPRPTVLLAGHLDTVPPDPADPTARLEGDDVVGRGASDMKGGDAVMLALAEDLDLAALPYGPVLARLPQLCQARLAFCLEPTDGEVQVGCVGSMHARVTFRGRAAHSARPWQGENAIHRAAPLLTELAARERVRVVVEGFEFFEVVSATRAHGGRASNVVPDSFELNLNFRFAPGKDVAVAEAELRALVAGRADVEIVDRAPAGRVCADNPLLQAFLASSGARATSKQAWTDVARLSAAGIDAVNFGPGLTAQAHQAGERVPAAALERCYLALRDFLTTPPATR